MSMGITVNIDPDQVNQAVTDAIIKSSLGKELQRAIETAIKELLTSGYRSDSLVHRVVLVHVEQEIRNILLSTENRERIHNTVRVFVEERMSDEVLVKATRAVFDKYFDQ